MDEPRPGRESNGSLNVDELFSVDADAHLRKLAACMFPTAAQLPVEMVRAALKRNAVSVAVELRRRRLVIEDDGDAIADGPWADLACAFDPGRGASEREAAIQALQDAASPGIGLLSVLVPDAEAIRVETAGPAGARALEVADGRVRRPSPRRDTPGTRIVITRRRGPVAAEIRLLRELCAAAGRRITLNGREIESKPLLRRTLVQQRIADGPGRRPPLVAVPLRGDTCRVWLLDQQIPWQAYGIAPRRGLVFEAAMESGAMPTEAEFGRLAAAALRLYGWLADHYASFPGEWQPRIEELLFERARAAGDMHLLSGFAPFRLWRSRQRLTLDEVRHRAEKGALFALSTGEATGRFAGRHGEALLLTPQQKDFLLNHLGLPLVMPTASVHRSGPWAALRGGLRALAALLASRLPRRPLKPLADDRLSEDERRLCRQLEAHWPEWRPRQPRPPLTVALRAGRGLFPACWRRQPAGITLLLRRRHPLVILARESVRRDRGNAELAFAALAPKGLLTAGPP